MKNLLSAFSYVVACSALIFCPSVSAQVKEELSEAKKKVLAAEPPVTVETAVGKLTLVSPFSSASVTKRSEIVAWPAGEMPKAPEGFAVSKFAEGLKHPRRTLVAPDGKDYFVVESDDAEKSANRIKLLRDTNGDGKVDETHRFAENLNQPYGMLILDGHFYVANVDSLKRWPYEQGMTSLKGEGEKIADLPAGGYNHHWTRNLLATKDGKKLLVTVGSSSNVGEHGMENEERRANILIMNPDGSGEAVYAAGLRNPVGMDYNPVTGQLWTAVNERDKIGDNLVPDYITSVKQGGWYGWPYSYYGNIKDPRWADDPHEDLVEKAIVPDVSMGSHTASLGLAFYDHQQFPKKYRNGAFVGQHGSWNRANFAGYKVVFVPFDDAGNPQPPEDFLSGFIANGDENQVYGRPVGVAVTTKGDLLVNDDDGGVIWRVTTE